MAKKRLSLSVSKAEFARLYARGAVSDYAKVRQRYARLQNELRQKEKLLTELHRSQRWFGKYLNEWKEKLRQSLEKGASETEITIEVARSQIKEIEGYISDIQREIEATKNDMHTIRAQISMLDKMIEKIRG